MSRLKIASVVLFAIVILLLIMQADIDKSSGPARSDDELARTITARSTQMWQAYQDKNEPAHSALLTDDYTAIHPEGRMHGRATAQQIAAAPIAGFRFSERKVWRLA